jgi:hypothetical protein
MGTHEDKTRYQLRQSKQTLIQQSTSYTASSVNSEDRRKSQLCGRKTLLFSCLRKETSGIETTTVVSCYYLSRVKFSTGSFLRE